MCFTIQNIPPHVVRAMRRRSRTQGRGIDDIALEALERGLSVDRTRVRYRDLSGVVGTWVEDPEYDLALLDQDRVDEEVTDLG